MNLKKMEDLSTINKEKGAFSRLDVSTLASEPPFYRVVLHNYDFTPIEFVVSVLEDFFFMQRIEATAVTLEAHVHGKATCGVFTKEVAETKVEIVTKFARQKSYPLSFSLEVVT